MSPPLAGTWDPTAAVVPQAAAREGCFLTTSQPYTHAH